MSLLGIDVGTTGCKSGLFSQDGRLLASAYEEYDFSRPEPGWAQLDSVAVWEQVKRTIRLIREMRSDHLASRQEEIYELASYKLKE